MSIPEQVPASVLAHYETVFSDDGPLARQVFRFRERRGQHRMAAAVADAIANQESLIIEAGTGTGKTLAYLIPALESGRKVIIATGTKSLQQQLFDKDLPAALAASGTNAAVALLKGRNNYLCRYRFDNAQAEIGQNSRAGNNLERLREWAVSTEDGDLDAHADAAELGPLWQRVTANADQCLGSECPEYENCWLVKARREAQQADVVVVNHHLLLADLSLREQGLGEVLPGADAYIIDEAHQWPEVAGQFMGLRQSAAQLLELVSDTRTEARKASLETPDLAKALHGVERSVAALGDCCRGMQAGERRAWIAELDHALPRLEEDLGELAAQLKPLSVNSKGLDQCHARASQFASQCGELSENDREKVRWVEMQKRGPSLSQTPLDVAGGLAEMRQRHGGAWILTSATVAVGGDFTAYLNRCGMPEAGTLNLASPFDYERQCMLYLPGDLPDPNARDFTQAVQRCIEPLIHASRGGCFLLCTSHRAVAEHAALLERSFEHPVLVQGSAPRDQLLADFREAGNAILVATASFWEGVDVRGDALRLVIIEKLPFASPADPLVAARSDALRSQGRSPFTEMHLPLAVTSLRQGVGRLIRDVTDRGLLVICDGRITRKSYGRLFLRSLPGMPRTDSTEQAQAFLRGMRA